MTVAYHWVLCLYLLTVKRKGCLYDGYISLGFMFIYAHCEEEGLFI